MLALRIQVKLNGSKNKFGFQKNSILQSKLHLNFCRTVTDVSGCALNIKNNVQ